MSKYLGVNLQHGGSNLRWNVLRCLAHVCGSYWHTMTFIRTAFLLGSRWLIISFPYPVFLCVQYSSISHYQFVLSLELSSVFLLALTSTCCHRLCFLRVYDLGLFLTMLLLLFLTDPLFMILAPAPTFSALVLLLRSTTPGNPCFFDCSISCHHFQGCFPIRGIVPGSCSRQSSSEEYARRIFPARGSSAESLCVYCFCRSESAFGAPAQERSVISPTMMVTPPEPRVLASKCFLEDQRKCRAFKNACQLYLAFQPRTCSVETVKVGFIISLLPNEPQSWVHNLVEQKSPALNPVSAFFNAWLLPCTLFSKGVRA